MNDKTQTIKLKNTDIFLFVEPNIYPKLFRFCVFNPTETKVKFLYNNKVYDYEAVEYAQKDFYIYIKQYGQVFEACKLRGLGILLDNTTYCLSHKYYSHPQLLEMIDTLTPVREQGEKYYFKEYTLAKYLSVEKKFVNCQKKYADKAQASLDADTESYLNF